MKTIAIPAQNQLLNNILKEASFEGIILESAEGQRFILAPLEGWEGFEVGEDDDITDNQTLMEFLINRKSESKKLSLSEVKRWLER